LLARREDEDRGKWSMYHAEESSNHGARREAERHDAHAQVEPEERVAVGVEDELDDVLGVAHVGLHIDRRIVRARFVDDEPKKEDSREERERKESEREGRTASVSTSLTTSSHCFENASRRSSTSS